MYGQENNATFRTNEITIEYFSQSRSGKPIIDVDVRVDVAPVRGPAPPGYSQAKTHPKCDSVPLSAVASKGPTTKLVFSLPPEDITLTLVARDSDAVSKPACLHLRWDGVRAAEMRLPRLRGLFVGESDYELERLKLPLAAKDAIDLASAFKAQQGKAYRKVDAQVLANAGRAAVLEGLEWLETGSEEGDVNLLFLAGHGITDGANNFYFLATDSNPERLRATGESAGGEEFCAC